MVSQNVKVDGNNIVVNSWQITHDQFGLVWIASMEDDYEEFETLEQAILFATEN